MDYLFFLLECPCKVCVWGECVFVILARSEQLILRGGTCSKMRKKDYWFRVGDRSYSSWRRLHKSAYTTKKKLQRKKKKKIEDFCIENHLEMRWGGCDQVGQKREKNKNHGKQKEVVEAHTQKLETKKKSCFYRAKKKKNILEGCKDDIRI